MSTSTDHSGKHDRVNAVKATCPVGQSLKALNCF